MVIVMQSMNTIHYVHKPHGVSTKTSRLYDKDSTPFEIPTARELIIERLTRNKWFEKEYTDLSVPFSEDFESQELCKLINVDWQDLDVSVIDEFLANKQDRCIIGERLTFKDFRLKH